MCAPPVLLEPDPRTWPTLLGKRSDHAPRFREQMGLPVDRPIVMTGHQVALWHPGILAKLLAAGAFATSIHADAAWLWVDQDDNDPTKLRVPTQPRDGSVGVTTWDLAPSAMVPGGTPVAARPPIEPTPFDAVPHPATREGAAEAIARSLLGHMNEPSLARQFAKAAFDLLNGIVPEPAQIFASTLQRTDLFAEMVESMGREPRTMAEAYNEACAAFADAGIRPLTIREGAIELPLWRIRPGEARMPVYSTQLDDIPRDQLAPRALLMTAIVRLAGCDLFIHGTGGEAYDRITEQWIKAWLGADLAPIAVASATRTLDVSDTVLPTDDEIAEARSRAHSAKHDPSIVGDQDAADRKADLINRIEHAKQAGDNPAPLFREMQRLLADYRERSASAIREIEEEAEKLDAMKELAAIAHDRTWAFALYPLDVLDDLQHQIDHAFEEIPR